MRTKAMKDYENMIWHEYEGLEIDINGKLNLLYYHLAGSGGSIAPEAIDGALGIIQDAQDVISKMSKQIYDLEFSKKAA